jgi:endonuclease YncB( thermonuclease family)
MLVPKLLFCVALFSLTTAETSFEGPVRAQVVRVIDGDTFDASARIWLGQAIEVRVRIMGIDAPELHARCDAERDRAEAAREYLARRIEGGEVKLTSVRYDKYGGRIDAAVADAGGDIAHAMLRAHMARPYEGGRRASWCED